MEILLKSTAVAIFASVVCVLIKKHNPEFSLLVSFLTTVLISIAILSLSSVLHDLLLCAQNMLGASSTFIKPLMKCMGIGFISKFGSDMCRDASQSALASTLEFAGVICSASVAMPVIISMLKMIGTMV